MMRRYWERFRPKSRGAVATPLRRRVALALATVLLLVSGCYLGFYLAFPAEAVRAYLQQEARRRWQLDLRIARLAPQLPAGITSEQLVVNLPRLELPVEQLEVHPLWSSLAGSNPGVVYSARLFGGHLDGTLRRQGELTVSGGQLALNLPLPQSAGLTLHGQLQEVVGRGALPARANGETELRLVMVDCALGGLKALGMANDRLELGRITLDAIGRGNSLTVKRFTAEGGALQASSEGTLMLASPIAQSRLNLTITLRPGNGLDPLLNDLLPLLAKSDDDGGYRLALSGALANPVLR